MVDGLYPTVYPSCIKALLCKVKREREKKKHPRKCFPFTHSPFSHRVVISMGGFGRCSRSPLCWSLTAAKSCEFSCSFYWFLLGLVASLGHLWSDRGSRCFFWWSEVGGHHFLLLDSGFGWHSCIFRLRFLELGFWSSKLTVQGLVWFLGFRKLWSRPYWLCLF